MFNTERLIELVKERTIIYDFRHSEHRNRQKKAEAWHEIADEMGYQSGEYWTLKWKSLKDNYNKFKKNKYLSAGEQYNKYRNWPWAELMSFMDDIYKNSDESSPLSTYKKSQTASSSRDPSQINRLKRKHNLKTASTSKDIQKKKEDDNHSIYELKRKRAASPDTNTVHYIQTNAPSDFDEVDLFFLSYAKNFKRLAAKSQALMKLEIASLFTRFELNEDSVTLDVAKNSKLYGFQSISSVYSDGNHSTNENDDSNES